MSNESKQLFVSGDKLKIAFVSQPWDEIRLPFEGRSSLSILTYELAKRLSSSDEVIIYTRHSAGQPAEETYNGIRFKRFTAKMEDRLLRPLKVLVRLLERPTSDRPLFSRSIYFFLYGLKIAIDLWRERCDIVHVHNFSQFIPIIRAFNPHSKIVLHMHCEWLSQLNHGMIRRRLKKTDIVIGVSEHITGAVRGSFPEFADRCVTLYNGIDTSFFAGETNPVSKEKKERRTILSVGRLSPEKGVHVLIEAFSQIAESIPDAELMLVGSPGPTAFEFIVLLTKDPNVAALGRFYRGKLKRSDYIAQLHETVPEELRNRVKFVGEITQREIAELYHHAAVFAFPSVWDEPFGIPVIEAMASGVPVVAARSGAVPEIIEDGKTGILVERADAQALGDGILKVLKNPQLSTSFSKAGRLAVQERFSWDRIAKQLQDIYARAS